uniref:Transposase MuDR plant domain-containing protein n=1 Tax=Arundo donax TaxID=35708 RepID=A0A0A9EX55_ARUDO
MVRICDEMQLAEMKWAIRQFTISVKIVDDDSAHHSPDSPTSELALVVVPSERDVNADEMIAAPTTVGNEALVPSNTAENEQEGPSATADKEMPCPNSYPEAPPPADDGYPEVEPGQFAEEDDEPVSINMEGQYSHIFEMELEPVTNKGAATQPEEPIRIALEDTVNEADEHGDAGIPDIPYFCHDKENPTIQIKATFSDKVTFVLALRQNAIKEEYDFHIEHSDSDRFRARCTNRECGWRIHASRLKPEKTLMVCVMCAEYFLFTSDYFSYASF